jgi:hypothetical protein
MKNVKVKGVLDETGVKNFMITNTDTGEVHVAMRDGQKFVLGEFTGTLKQCKELVAASKVVHFADAPPEPESNHSSWDCVHPCALLIKLASTTFKHEEEIHRTLDAFGWMKPDGTPDFEGADKNYEKWSKQ